MGGSKSMVSEALDPHTSVDAEAPEARRENRSRSRLPTSPALPVAAIVLGCVLTAFSLDSSWVPLAYRLPRMHGVLESAIGLVSVLVAYLVYGRVRTHGRLRDLVLAF